MGISGTTESKNTIWNARRILIFVLAVAMGLFHVYTAGVRALPAGQQRTIHLSFALALVFLMYPFRPKKTEGDEVKIADEQRSMGVIDVVMIICSFFPGLYVFLDYEGLSLRIGEPSMMDTACALMATILVLEATRRIIGWSIVIICLVGFAYLAFGTHLPAYLAHSGYSFEEVVNFLFYSNDGILGLPLGVSATVIIVFIIFGGFLQLSGAGPLLIDIGLSIFGKFRGGPAKAAVIASCCFGMMTGNQLANVAAVGVLTIPLMIGAGYRPITAASIEALASTGAMLVPPVMGAAAFIIPEIIGGSYWDVCKAAVVPGLLFYVSVYMIVELQAAKFGIHGMPKDQLPVLRKLIFDRGYLIFPILVLVYLIAVARVSTSRAGFWSIIAAIAISQFRPKTRMGPRKIAAALEKGAKGSLIVACCCASAGIITGIINISGLGMRFSDILVTLAGGSLPVLLVLTMFASLVLWLPLPPVTCYLILAVLAAPALIRLGVTPMAAHLFVFFFGTLANISPPVAPTSFAAAGLASVDPVKTTNVAFVYSLPSFLVPYLYVYSNELLLMGTPLLVAYKVFSSFIGISCMAVTFNGYLFRELNWGMRTLFLIGGLAMLFPHWILTVPAYVFVGLILALELARYKKGRAVAGTQAVTPR